MKRNRSALLFSKCQMRRTINTCRPINCMVTICSFRSFYLWQKLVVDINNYYMYGYRCHRRFYAWVKLERGLCLTDPMLGSRSWLRAMSSFTPKLENKGNFSWGKGDIFLCELSWNSHFLSNRNSPTEKGGKTSNRDWHVGGCSSFLSMWVILSLSL